MDTYVIDSDQSTLKWKAQTDHEVNSGEIGIEGGKFFVELGKIVKGFVRLDLDDLKVDNYNQLSGQEEQQLLQALRSESFLDARQFPSAEYRLERLREKQDHALIHGILVWKDRAMGMNFSGDVTMSEKKIHATSEISLDEVNPVAHEQITGNHQGSPIDDIAFKIELTAFPEQV